MSDPYLPEVGVLALVPERFDVPWMPRHQILTRLARFYRVAWLSPAPEWRELFAKSEARHPDWELPRPDGLHVREPEPWLPRFYRPAWLGAATDTGRLGRARRDLVRRGCRHIVLYVWRPGFAPSIDRVEHELCLYHIDDEYTFSEEDLPVPEEERGLIERADRVIIHSPGLLAKKGGFNPDTHFLPNGVDFATVAAAQPEPADLAAIPGPRIGYCGWLKNQLDWALIEALVARHTDRSFVFAGAVAPHPGLEARLAALDAHPNVHLLGAKTPQELLAYPQHFDVCIMPYMRNAYTDCIYPLKLHEYLGSGSPVVGTPIRTLRDFSEVVELASTLDEWSEALERALGPDAATSEAAARRQAVARSHDWNPVAYQVAQLIAEPLGDAMTQRLASLSVPDGWKA